MALMMQLLVLALLPWAFLLPPGGWAGEIIGGKEAKPHSRPYMAFLKMRRGNDTYRCGGFLVAENFVLTAAHCWGDSITVTLGAHNIDQREPSQQVIPVQWQIPHPRYNWETLNKDIMLLQEVELKVQGHRVCRKIPGVPDIRYKPSTMMCVGDPNQPQASFKGDSGGPLVCRGVAQGIVSWGSPSGVPPRVYVRLSTFIPWIYETMKELQAH